MCIIGRRNETFHIFGVMMKIFKVLSAVALCACFSAQATLLNFNDYTIDSYGGAQQAGVGTNSVSADGSTLKLEGNIWSSIARSTTISASTILYFDFMSTSEGEIHGIGFERDGVLSEEFIFQLDGIQNWGIQAFDDLYNTGSGSQTYNIDVGQYFTGDFDRLGHPDCLRRRP